MEKSVNDLFEFSLDPGQISALSLAYIGDAVYEMYIRSYLMHSVNMPVSKLHKESTHFVSATSQAKILRSIKDNFSDVELSVYKRGRNAHPHTSAKNADIIDYKTATGFEALIGYLYIKKDIERVKEIITMAINYIKSMDDNK